MLFVLNLGLFIDKVFENVMIFHNKYLIYCFINFCKKFFKKKGLLILNRTKKILK